MTVLCVASLSDIASFISGGTGTAAVGTESGTPIKFCGSSIERTAKLIYINWTVVLNSHVSISKVFMVCLVAGTST